MKDAYASGCGSHQSHVVLITNQENILWFKIGMHEA